MVLTVELQFIIITNTDYNNGMGHLLVAGHCTKNIKLSISKISTYARVTIPTVGTLMISKRITCDIATFNFPIYY